MMPKRVPIFHPATSSPVNPSTGIADMPANMPASLRQVSEIDERNGENRGGQGPSCRSQWSVGCEQDGLEHSHASRALDVSTTLSRLHGIANRGDLKVGKKAM